MTEEDLNLIESNYRNNGYDVAVDCFIINEKNEVFAQKRSSSRRLYPNCWDFAGGHIDEGDNLYNTIHKEILEETGLKVISIDKFIQAVPWTVPPKSLRNGENPKKVIVQFTVTCDLSKQITLEENKADDYLWINSRNIEILKENKPKDDQYSFDSITNLFKIIS